MSWTPKDLADLRAQIRERAERQFAEVHGLATLCLLAVTKMPDGQPTGPMVAVVPPSIKSFNDPGAYHEELVMTAQAMGAVASFFVCMADDDEGQRCLLIVEDGPSPSFQRALIVDGKLGPWERAADAIAGNLGNIISKPN